MTLEYHKIKAVFATLMHLMLKYACVGENFSLLKRTMMIYSKQTDDPFLGHDA
jgi:hypothetical protein